MKKCFDLKRNDNSTKVMKPFFSYEFYIFDFKSATVTGRNPEFDSTKVYKVE